MKQLKQSRRGPEFCYRTNIFADQYCQNPLKRPKFDDKQNNAKSTEVKKSK